MTRRRRRSDEEIEAEQKESESDALEESNGSSDISEKILKRFSELEEKTEDVVAKLGLAVMDARDADAKVKKLGEKFKDIEAIADELEDKLDRMDKAEKRLSDLEEDKENLLTQMKKFEESQAGKGDTASARLEDIVQSIEELNRKAGEVTLLQERIEGLSALQESIGALQGRVEELPVIQEGLGALLDRVDEFAHMQESVNALSTYMEEMKTSGGAASADLGTRVEAVEREFRECIASLRDLVEGHRSEVAPLIERVGEQAQADASRAMEMVKGVEEKVALLSESLGQDVAQKLEALSKGPGQEELQARFSDLGEKIGALERVGEEKARSLIEINEELKQIDERYRDIVHRLDEMKEKGQGEIKQALEDSETRTREMFGKVQGIMEGAQGITQTIDDTRSKVAGIEEKLQAASAQYEEMAAKMNEVVSRSETSFEKANVAFKLIDEAEKKIHRIIAPVDDQILQIEGFETMPEIGELGFDLTDLIQVMVKHQASDLHLKEGSPPTVRLEGDLVPVGNQMLTGDECRYLVFTAMNRVQRRMLLEKKELDFAYASPEARFRVNAFMQKGTVSASFRMLKTEIPSLEELGLPVFLKKLCNVNHGLILITGPAGSGKSTTLASIIDYINTNRKLHIVTIEDPIEFIHADKMSIVTQREVGTDTPNFGTALKSSLRQDPNVILIGEMRDAETMWTATMAAETGHLVLSTLHTPNTLQAIDRILDAFAGEQQKQFRILLASNLRSVISQRLLTRVDGEGRIPATEILVVTPTVASLILEKKTQDIYPLMVQGATEGMQTFTASLTKLLEGGLISKEDAIYQSDRPTEFRLGVEGHTSGSSAIPDDSLMSWL